jgi:hypothetical protein
MNYLTTCVKSAKEINILYHAFSHSFFSKSEHNVTMNISLPYTKICSTGKPITEENKPHE